MKYKHEKYFNLEWGIEMEKENNDLNQLLKNREDYETLEISSTGFGLESVSQKEKKNKQVNHNPSNCGGL